MALHIGPLVVISIEPERLRWRVEKSAAEAYYKPVPHLT
jgi:hypothetical protein